MPYHITVLPQKQNIETQPGETLLDALRHAGFAPDAPCSGNGTCGKCKVYVDGVEQLACQTPADRDMTVMLPPERHWVILTDGIATALPVDSGVCLAVDIGTTTVAAYLLENGQTLCTESRKNPQAAFGADVVSRIRLASTGSASAQTAAIRRCVEDLTNHLLARAGKPHLNTVCIVGNPAMQQLFLGLPVDNLTKIPFLPLLTTAEIADGGSYLSAWAGADLLIIPDISGYIGADTVACILATGMDQAEKMTLLVDIGTNGEIVLGNKDRLVACATAAGPALEGAGIRFGMQAAAGAIDHVGRDFSCHVIGDDKAQGLCGSGLLDAVAAALDNGLINQRGRILNDSHTLPLTDDIFLTQEDIRQLQQAKGAIAAGIALLAEHLHISLNDIETVYLAGAFGSFLDPRAACRVGLIPAVLQNKLLPVGNAAGSGAKLMACSRDAFTHSDRIAASVELLELATLPGWAKCFARHMHFETQEIYWCAAALSLGFTNAVPLDPTILTPRQDVRDMCAADQCRAYGKNWTCPPHCGTLEQCAAQLQCFHRGILVQTVGKLEKSIDTRGYRRTEAQHLKLFSDLCDLLRKVHPDALCLGTGGCRICKHCAFPEPCRFPEKACSSMEAYGLFITQVCRDCGIPYHHGERTVTYTACILF